MDTALTAWSWWSVTVVGVILTLCWSLCDKWWGYRNKRPPGPLRLPILGNLPIMLPAVLDPTKKTLGPRQRDFPDVSFLSKYMTFQPAYIITDTWSKKYGPILSLQFGMNHAVIIGSSKYAREVFCREEFSHRFADGWFVERSFGKALGLIFNNGESYRKIKNFTVKNLKDFGFGKKQSMEAAVEEELLDFLQYLGDTVESERNDNIVKMEHSFTLPVLNILWNMVAGIRFSYDDRKLLKLIKTVNELSQSFDIGGNILMAFPWLRHVAPSFTGHSHQMLLYGQLHQFFREIFHERRALGSYVGNPKDFVDIFLQRMDKTTKTEEESKLFTEEQFIMVCLDLFTAGSETTANTLDFAILYMILNPGVQKKVQEEIDEVIGRSRLPTLADGQNMPYTEATLIEVQRMCNVIPLVHRVATKDTTLGGYNIKKDDVLIVNLHTIHMDDTIWADPQAFRPERFLDKSQSLTNHFLPFGMGKRVCIGEILAKLTLFTYFTATLQRFSFSPAPNYPPPSTSPGKGFTICPEPYFAEVKCRI